MIRRDEETVRTVVEGFAEAWNRHDMEALARLFTADAQFVNVAGRRWNGRTAIRDNHAFTHATIPQNASSVENPAHLYGVFKTSTFHYDRIDMRFIRPDIALVQAAWTIRGDTRTIEPRRGTMLMVTTAEHSDWLFSAVQNTEIERTVK